VTNIANPTYFAAYKDDDSMNPMNCGLCAEISYAGRSIVATIVDDCATCNDVGHLDLSMSAADALGLTQMKGDPTSGVTWTSVSCPVSGDIVASFNNGYTGQVYFQNVVFPVASAAVGGNRAMFAYGYWDFGGQVGGQSVTLTDALGHTVSGTIPSNGGSIGVQFPDTCQ
jgi:expansin (peptidoglycan-binding protein)